MQSIIPVILSGGSGTRLWPLSRGIHPKQFMDISGQTLFGQTLARAEALPGSAAPIVICNEDHRFLAAAIMQDQAKNAGSRSSDRLPPGGSVASGASAKPAGSTGQGGILLEPVGRNTAPAIALAAMAARQDGGDPLLLVLSSDHIIEPQEAFAASVSLAATVAEQGKLAVFGVPPTRAETGYGYIKHGVETVPGVAVVDRFVEKPSLPDAQAMLEAGGYTWNSGMFLFRASVFLRELETYAPDVHKACLAIWESRSQDLDFTRFKRDLFLACPAISVDYAVMEHTKEACVVNLSAEWHDMGSWDSFYETGAKDEAGNACVGDVICLDTQGSYLHASHRMLAAVGVRDISVVETADAVLVVGKDRSQDVKLLMEQLKAQGRPETETHLKVYRPWGSYQVLAQGQEFQVKRIIVEPGRSLSLQLHHHRAEHWVVVRGTAKVDLGDSSVTLAEDMSTYIPLGVKHRLENPGRIPVEIIEIQSGSYLGEDDIVRFEDSYGRV